MVADPDEVPIAELLRRLNSLREDIGKPELRSWRGSRTDLINAIDTVKVEAEAALEARLAAVENGPSVLEGHPLHTEMKALDEKKPSRKEKQKQRLADAGEQRRAERADKATFTLSELAAEHDVLPKNARSKARRHADKLKPHMVGDGWVFKASSYDAVKKLIVG